MTCADVAKSLGIDVPSVAAIADAGMLHSESNVYSAADVDRFIARLGAAAIPTASGVDGVGLAEAVAAAGLDSKDWPAVLTGILKGHVNVFRRPGGYREPAFASLVVSSETVLAQIVAKRQLVDDVPFIWMPRIG